MAETSNEAIPSANANANAGSLLLAPSQTIDSRSQSRSTSSSSGDRPSSEQQQPQSNQKGCGGGAKTHDKNETKSPPPAECSDNNNAATQPGQQQGETNNTTKKKSNRNRNRNRPNKANKNDPNQQQQQQQATPKKDNNNNSPQQPNHQQQPGKNRKRNQRQRQNRKKRNDAKRYPWRRHIPDDECVDPITLERLDTLPYPPFALFAELPYTPIEEWPFPESDEDGGDVIVEDAAATAETEEQRQQRILQEQWGKQLTVSSSDNDNNVDPDPPAPATSDKDRHVHLYDGRALAYYCVSQLQFIDPLNRRDLTRDELVTLDRYLKRHGFQSLNVTEAYDAKGVTLSKAGAAATTAAGRAAILQQEAAILLNSLFGGGGGAPLPSRPGGGGGQATAAANQPSSLMQGYQAHEQQEQLQRQRQQQQGRSRGPRQQQRHQQPPPDQEEDTGIYGDAGGVLVIDDDMNPGLRGNNTSLRGDAQEFVPGSNTGGSGAPYTLWSSSHIASQFGHRAEARAAEFPALAAQGSSSKETSSGSGSSNSNKKPLPKSNTLSKIAVSVKKTTPEESQRMHEAHEKWLKRMEMTNLTFGGGNPVGMDTGDDQKLPPTEVSVPSSTTPTEAQLERNRAFATALGVKPSTVRKSDSAGKLSGWARPTGSGGWDEFGRELVAAAYPDELIAQAKERMALLIKLERRWKLFLEDDTTASLPLWPMDRDTREFVHTYSDFWKLQTESFDREPKRYIHCVKLLDTREPAPLLSEAARSWKAPSSSSQPAVAATVDMADLPRHSGQTAGETTTQTPSRWEGLQENPTSSTTTPPRQRPELKLQKRTLPLELPPFEPPASSANKDYFTSEERELRQKRMEEKARRERAQVEAKRAALEAAFASDDDEDDEKFGCGSNNDGDDSDWTQEEEQYDANAFGDEE